MKVFASMLIAATVLTAGVVAEAQYYPPRRGGYYPPPNRNYPPRYPDRRYPRRGGDSVEVGVACAPEVLEGNVKATDRTLSDLAKTSAFANASTFKAQVARISAMNDSAAKSAEYFGLIGIDASNSEAVVEFIGAREASSAQLAELERNADLSAAQANVVAASLQSALKGGLQ